MINIIGDDIFYFFGCRSKGNTFEIKNIYSYSCTNKKSKKYFEDIDRYVNEKWKLLDVSGWKEKLALFLSENDEIIVFDCITKKIKSTLKLNLKPRTVKFIKGEV